MARNKFKHGVRKKLLAIMALMFWNKLSVRLVGENGWLLASWSLMNMQKSYRCMIWLCQQLGSHKALLCPYLRSLWRPEAAQSFLVVPDSPPPWPPNTFFSLCLYSYFPIYFSGRLSDSQCVQNYLTHRLLLPFKSRQGKVVKGSVGSG